MQVKELKEICKLVGVSGLIDEFTITKDGHVFGFDAAKTLLADLKYNIVIPYNIYITNIKGINEVLTKFTDDAIVEISENQLHFIKDDQFYKIPLAIYEESKFNLPMFTENDYQVIAENIDYNILNMLGKLRAQSLTDETYYLYVVDNKLMFRVGDEIGSHGGKFIGITKKCTSNETIHFTMNISECFKKISTNANINIFFGKLMMIESNTEKYNVKYYLAPRTE